MSFVRRSTRQTVPTGRVLQYQKGLHERRLSNEDPFPSACDVILVQWIMDGEKVWWPADVLCIDEPDSLSAAHSTSGSVVRTGRLKYRSLHGYPCEVSNVLFTSATDRSCRLVSVLGENNEKSSSCSWIFPHEKPHEIDSDINSDNNSENNSDNNSDTDSESSSDLASLRLAITTRRSRSRTAQPLPDAGSSTAKKRTIEKSTSNRTVKQRTQSSSPQLRLAPSRLDQRVSKHPSLRPRAAPSARAHITHSPSQPTAQTDPVPHSPDIPPSSQVQASPPSYPEVDITPSNPPTAPPGLSNEGLLLPTGSENKMHQTPSASAQHRGSQPSPSSSPPRPFPPALRTKSRKQSRNRSGILSRESEGDTETDLVQGHQNINALSRVHVGDGNRAVSTTAGDGHNSSSAVTEFLLSSMNSKLNYVSSNLSTFNTSARRSVDNVALSTHAHAVLSSLKWNLLKRLEKPLRKLTVPQLSERGVASVVIAVRSDCDYATFSHIASSVAASFDGRSELCPTTGIPATRVRFHPDFARTQSGSQGADNLSISFTCLSDLMDFLGVRDEDDFEKILCTEVDSSRCNLLQIVGTLTFSTVQATPLHDSVPADDLRSTISTTNVRSTVQREPYERMTITVGASPLAHMEAHSDQDTEDIPTRSYMFEQNCAHFQDHQMCYGAPWKKRTSPSKFQLSRRRGLQGDPDRNMYFVLNWTQCKPPSTMKWSRDAQCFGTSFPGRLELTVPTVFTSSRPNVRSISSLLDTTIEEILRQRIILQNIQVQQHQ